MGATHLKAFSAIGGVEVGAISTSNPRSLEGDLSHIRGNLGRETGIYDFSKTRKYSDWRELLTDPELDAVDICLPTDLHVEASQIALNAGKHVLCEKPMALSADGCDQMIAAAKKNDRILMIAQVLRFWPEYKFLERFVRSGEYGKIRNATFVRRCGIPDWSKWLPHEERSGGALLDLLVHDIDQILFLFGMPAKVAAKSLGEIDTVSATCIYDGGPEVRLQGGWFSPETPFAMGFQVRAERAELELTPDGLTLNTEKGQEKISPEGADGYEAETAYFVECCRSHQRPERCLPEDSANAVRLALAMKESRNQGGKQIACQS